MNSEGQVAHRACAVDLLTLVVEVDFDDSRASIEPAELFLRIFRGLASTWPHQRWNYFVKLFDDVPADSGTVFHPGLSIACDLVVGTVDYDVKPVSRHLPDRAI